jgi:hypothetical protein
MNIFEITNDGPEIVRTTYWASEMARAGYCYLTPNAGTIRLLVPSSLESNIAEMLTGKVCVITRGHQPEHQREMLELLFDDNSTNPYVLLMSLEQVERIGEFGPGPRSLVIYGQSGAVHAGPPCYYREGNLP